MARAVLSQINELRDRDPLLAEILESMRTEIQSNRTVISGTGSPEGIVSAIVGTMYMRRDPVVGVRAMYVKNAGAGNNQGWQQIWTLNEILEDTQNPVTVPDAVNGGVDPGDPFLSRITQIRHGNIFLPHGSVIPTLNGGFTYTSTASSIDWAWADMTIYPSALNADGTAQTIVVANGNQNNTGLADTTTYQFFPYWDIFLAAIGWVGGGAGSPGFAHLATSKVLAQQQTTDGRIPLSGGGPMAATTGMSGSGGGDTDCLRVGTLIEIYGFGFKPVESVREGDLIRGRLGWVTVKQVLRTEQRQFLRFKFSNGEVLDVSPTNPFSLENGCVKHARDLTLSDLLIFERGALAIDKIEVINEKDDSIHFSCDPEHEFRVGRTGVLCHNLMAKFFV